jgi:hypothetical protein
MDSSGLVCESSQHAFETEICGKSGNPYNFTFNFPFLMIVQTNLFLFKHQITGFCHLRPLVA